MSAGTEEVEALFRRLERLTRILLRPKFPDAGAIWRFQLDLLRLQQDVQDSIGAQRTEGRSASGAAILADLRNMRWHARRLGDALAWLLLRLERQFISPLGENDPVPIPRESDGLRGQVFLAQTLSSDETGFPLLHDITDCLRIGDLTFIRPDSEPRTIEIKTRTLGEEPRPNGDGVVKHYSVSMMWQGTNLEFPAHFEKSDPAVAPPPTSRWRPRSARQADRMARANSRQSAPDGLTDGDTPVLTLTLKGPRHKSHLDLVKRVLRRARRTGYASAAAGGAFFYCAFYGDEGIDVERLEDSGLVEDLLRSGVLIEEEPDRHKNAIILCEIPKDPSRACQDFLPFHLVGLPMSTVVDLQRGRMYLMNVVNLGRVVLALESAGLTVSTEDGSSNFAQSSLVVSREIRGPEGERLEIGAVGLTRHLDEMVQELRPVEYIVGVATDMLDAAERALPQLQPAPVGPERRTSYERSPTGD